MVTVIFYNILQILINQELSITFLTLAISLRCDGSIDRMQVDKMYVLVKIINNEGNLELLFLGAEEPKECGVKDIVQAIEDGYNKIYDKGSFKQIISKSSSIVTDGVKCNTKGKKDYEHY